MSAKKPGTTSLVLTLLWWALIWILSSVPSDDLPSLQIFSSDKLAHIGVYFVLGLLVNSWLKTRQIKASKRSLIYLALLCSALLDEYHQTFIPGRSVSIYDFLANALGLGFAWTAGFLNRDQRPES
ncbi:MAG TPA: VanZ family protein [Candidatus Cloacimonadota bacterium]|nr:VanZ family protein [Candidatus Cloacimonadota bacterium]